MNKIKKREFREDMPAVHGSPPPGAGVAIAEEIRRPTPLDPYPEPRLSEVAAGDEKAYPPELGPDAIAILEGTTFIYSDSRGDVPSGSIGGLLHDDTRFLSKWELRLNGAPLSVLKSQVVDYYSAAFFLTNPDLPGLRANTLAVRRLRFVGGGLHEQIGIRNSATEPVRFEIRLSAGADYADLFEVKSRVRDRSAQIDKEHDPGAGSLSFHYEVPGFSAGTNLNILRSGIIDESTLAGMIGHREGPDVTTVRTAPLRNTAPRIKGDDLVWDLELAPREFWGAEIRATLRVNGRVLEPMYDNFAQERKRAEGALTSWLDKAPRFASGNPLIENVLNRSVTDLGALRIVGEYQGESFVMPAAGLPWFMTLFGRDTLITSLQTVWVGPELTRGALQLFSALQGKKTDAFTDEEPGRILHEFRRGELTITGEKPHSPYYGSADTTPLYLILMAAYWRCSNDGDFVRRRWGNVLAALEWIDRFGDRDSDGYVEYQTKSPQGLGNQCWKDSWDGVQFSDGRLPYLPIATAEIQGYVYDAKLRIAELAESLMDDRETATRLRSEAQALFERFNRDFWSEARGGYYVIGIDGDKRQIDSMTSNMGHLLWSGIVPEDRARIVRDHLMSDDMFSGWGIRTMSRKDAGYNPIGYHTGTIWPHDNSIVAQGLARYGFRDEANRIAMAQLEAASFSGYRLPEAFAGLTRGLARFPIPYPTACSPQAWATGAPFVFLQVMLGLDARSGRITLDPRVPDEIGRVFVHGLSAFGTRWDVEAKGTEGRVRPAA